MESNVQTLLAEERKVNEMVQKALRDKNDLLRDIKRQADISVAEYRKTLEENHRRALIEVSRNS